MRSRRAFPPLSPSFSSLFRCISSTNCHPRGNANATYADRYRSASLLPFPLSPSSAIDVRFLFPRTFSRRRASRGEKDDGPPCAFCVMNRPRLAYRYPRLGRIVIRMTKQRPVRGCIGLQRGMTSYCRRGEPRSVAECN